MKKGKAKLIIRQHNGYTEWEELAKHYEKLGKEPPIKQYFGQFQFLLQTSKGVVSIVQLWDLFSQDWYWEIAKFKKKGFDGDSIERFGTFEGAQKRAWEILS